MGPQGPQGPAGPISGVTAGTALTGGGTSGTVTLKVDTTQVPLLSSSNTFTQEQVFEPAGNGEAIHAFAYSAPSGSGQGGNLGIFTFGGSGDPSSSVTGGGDGIDAYGGNGGQRGGSGGVLVGGSGGPDGGNGLYAFAGTGGSLNGDAGDFYGDVLVTGTIYAGTKDFKIDHPLDPANKYLVHASVESSEMMNIYTGNVTTDGQGSATVQLPGWFEALNTDFRYQLTVIGQFAQAVVAREIQNHQFEIRTNAPNVKVSWQVTGVRQDAYAKAHPLVVEEEKDSRTQGFYIHPELYGAPAEKQIEWGRHPEMMKRLKEKREAAQQRLRRAK